MDPRGPVLIPDQYITCKSWKGNKSGGVAVPVTMYFSLFPFGGLLSMSLPVVCLRSLCWFTAVSAGTFRWCKLVKSQKPQLQIRHNPQIISH